MTMRTVARVTVRVFVVILLLSAASAHTVAAFDGTSPATFDQQSVAGDVPDQRTNNELLNLSSHTAEKAVPAVVENSAIQTDVSERLERMAQYGVQSLCESDEILPYLGFVLSYSRYDSSDPLENENRVDVYKSIIESPGIYISKLSGETVIHRSTVRYHIRVLEEEGLIVEKVLQGKHRLYPVEASDLSLVAALDDEATASVLQALLRLEPASVSLLADDLNRTPSTISYHLSRLAEDELITQERDGNTVLTRLPQHVREVLQSAETAVSSETESASMRAD
jgi:DNA-binding transcriptional ArsR family regulator